MELTEKERLYLIERLQNGEAIPPDFKYKLFPTEQKEYELSYAGKMRREDILANEDGVFPVPLQIEKSFNGDRELFDDGWKNMIVFGDNLQFLKTAYHNQDELIKDKVKGKVKLIYIDPPFGTASDFDTSTGQIAYTDKAKGADFVEFVRRRLVIARELLASDGTIYVHLDSKKGHSIKVLMDEIFTGFQFAEIVWVCGLMGSGKFFPKAHEVIYCYKSPKAVFNAPPRLGYSQRITKALQKDAGGWFYTRGKESSGGSNYLKTYICDNSALTKEQAIEEATKNRPQTAWDVWMGKSEIAEAFNDYPVGTYAYTEDESVAYPTQKPESLLKRIIETSTNPGDLVFDFFGGSGTTAAVSEKLKRRWIVCDIGKLSFYTIQKRLLQIQESKDLKQPSKDYGIKAKTFVTVNTGFYDLQKLWELNQEKYREFVLNLFEVDRKPKKIAGIQIDGERFGSYAMVWQFWEYKDSSVDETFLETLHQSIGGRIGDRFYIIAPANAVDFISDYHEIGNVRYYFLKVPYQIIQELHKKQFKKFRQPQSKSKINELDDVVGFHFMRQPEVKSRFENDKLILSRFVSSYSDEDTGQEMDNFESLSMVIVDENYNGKEFVMTHFFFAEDLLKTKKKEQTDGELKTELKHQTQISIPLNPKGKHICAIYVDIYGNEFKEELRTK